MVETLGEMFEHSLEEMYYVETRQVEELDEMAAEVDNDRLSEGFADHQEETRRHVERLESVFRALDRDPAERESLVLDALAEERERFAGTTAHDALRDLYEMQAAMKTERLEITGYQGLLTLADHLDYPSEVTDPLEQNLSAEKSTLRHLEGLSTGSKMKSMIEGLVS
jgi:ferritin-like metal-binding protein YciE